MSFSESNEIDAIKDGRYQSGREKVLFPFSITSFCYEIDKVVKRILRFFYWLACCCSVPFSLVFDLLLMNCLICLSRFAGIPIFDNAKGADIVGSLISSFRHDAAEVLVGELEKKTENEWKAMLLEEIRHLRELLPIADGILLYDLTTSRRLLAKPEFLKALSSLKSV